MSDQRRPPTVDPAKRLFRSADQAVVAMVVVLGLIATVGWWLSQGGWQRRLIEVERAQPQVANFHVDVNRANWPELVQLPGIGPTLARRIVDSRETEGPFLDHDDLRRVRGIGPKTLDAMRPYLRPMAEDGMLVGQ